MTVALTTSKTKGGAEAGDTLAGSSTGYDLGASQNGDADPTQRELFISHNGAMYIYNLAAYLAQYSGTYGGAYTAADDLAEVLAHGDAGYGLEFGFNWQASNKFAAPTRIRTGVGDSFANRVLIPATAMSRDVAAVETAPTAPVAGKIGSGTGETEWVLNPTFGSAANWTIPAEAAITGGQLVCTNAPLTQYNLLAALQGDIPTGVPFTFSVDIKSWGGAGTANFQVRYYNSDTAANSQLWQWFENGGTGVKTKTGTLGAGTYNKLAIFFGDGGGQPVTVTLDDFSLKFAGLDVPTLGDKAHCYMRYVVPQDETQPGKRQFDVVFYYNYLN